MRVETEDAETVRLALEYAERLSLPLDELWLTTDQATFQRWLGRRLSSSVGGAYAFRPWPPAHLVLINLPRIDRARPRALEIVIAEELIHMRDRLDGDLRRHAKHGYDRIALRVAQLTGATLEEIRSCLLPSSSRPYRYLYECPRCGQQIRRRVRGTWSCALCAPRFDRRLILRLVAENLDTDAATAALPGSR
jgi:hypothetical protein